MMRTLPTRKIGIVGYGYVGKAVHYGLGTSCTEFVIVDPVLPNTASIDDIGDTHCVFICVPSIVSNEAQDAVLDTINRLRFLEYRGVVVVKSTLPLMDDDHIQGMFGSLRYAINPEFLTEANSIEDFCNPTQIVLGTHDYDVYSYMEELYARSYVRRRWLLHMTPAEAIAYKLFINVFLATKVSLINEFKTIHEYVSSTDWNSFADKLRQDPRFGGDHIYSPGPDGRVGYGGKCLPACTESMIEFAQMNYIHIPTIIGGANTNYALRGKESPLGEISSNNRCPQI